jgi:hypothetical protein
VVEEYFYLLSKALQVEKIYIFFLIFFVLISFFSSFYYALTILSSLFYLLLSNSLSIHSLRLLYSPCALTVYHDFFIFAIIYLISVSLPEQSNQTCPGPFVLASSEAGAVIQAALCGLRLRHREVCA